MVGWFLRIMGKAKVIERPLLFSHPHKLLAQEYNIYEEAICVSLPSNLQQK
jgi:hypothetical protein